MIRKVFWKTWSLPLCLSVTLAAPPVFGDEVSPAEFDDAPLSVLDDDEGQPLPELETPGPVTASISDDEDAGEYSAPQAADEDAAVEALAPEGAAEPDEADQPAATPAPAAVDDTSEVIEERYPNGALRIVREVVQDAQGNYLNHGAWKMLSEKGAVLVEGQFYEDARHGVWNRWYRPGEVAFLKQKPFTDFTPPYVSQGIFDSGDLHGAWIIYDAKQRKICEIRFQHGEREGVATWWHPNGRKMRELKYDKGTIDGEAFEWAPDGTVVRKDLYDQGRRLITQTVHFGGDVKKFSGQFLEPELQTKQLDDWWKGEMATYSSQGQPIKHGVYTAWHPNGQMRMQGKYEYDVPVGTFTWWYPNGQKSLEGAYDEGKQEEEWAWWHENGQRSIRGYFTAGNPSGKWTWWNQEGKVAQSGDFSDDKSEIVVTPVNPTPPARQAQQPTNPARR